MSEHSIVALTLESRKFGKSQRNNDQLLKCRLGKLELSFQSPLEKKLFESILEKVFAYTIKLSDLGQFYIVCGKTDLRKGIDSLAYLSSKHKLDPFSGAVFLFCCGRSDRFKALYWDGQGFWLLYIRFENGFMT